MLGRQEHDLGVELRASMLELVLVVDLDDAFEPGRHGLDIALSKHVRVLACDEQPGVCPGGACLARRPTPDGHRQGSVRRNGTRCNQDSDSLIRKDESVRAFEADLDERRDPLPLGDRLAQPAPVGHARRS